MTIHKAGTGTLVKVSLMLLVLNMGIYYWTPCPYAYYTIATLSIIIFLILVNFFRAPQRMIEIKEGCIISPADGTVVVIEPVEESEYFKDQRLQISVFMSITNVHINWIPLNGVIKFYRHHKGRFMAAYLPKSSVENERSTVVIENEMYGEILVRQVAGAMARRIVTYVEEGKQVTQKDQLGFIKLGSRVDLYLPLDAKVCVGMKQKVVGSQTILAMLNKAE